MTQATTQKRSAQISVPSSPVCSNKSEVKRNPRKGMNAYDRFLQEASQEVKDRFYLKLAGVVLKVPSSTEI